MLKTIWSADNLLLLMAEDIKIGSSAGNYKDKTIKRLLSKNLDKVTEYLIPEIRLMFT